MYMDKIDVLVRRIDEWNQDIQIIGLPDNSIIKYIRLYTTEKIPFTVKINGIPVYVENMITKCYIEASGNVVVSTTDSVGRIELIYFFPE